MATPGIVGARHYSLAQEIRRTLAQYAQLKDIIAILGLEQLSPEDRNVVTGSSSYTAHRWSSSRCHSWPGRWRP
jgi:F0F1-type ATP synthase beta subunit